MGEWLLFDEQSGGAADHALKPFRIGLGPHVAASTRDAVFVTSEILQRVLSVIERGRLSGDASGPRRHETANAGFRVTRYANEQIRETYHISEQDTAVVLEIIDDTFRASAVATPKWIKSTRERLLCGKK